MSNEVEMVARKATNGKTIQLPANVKSAAIGAVKIHADGTREDLGIVAYWHKNPLKRWQFVLQQWWRKLWKSSTKSSTT
jgi:hypothetical protein